MGGFKKFIPDWIVIDCPLVNERQKRSKDGVLRHGLEDSTGPDHVGEAG